MTDINRAIYAERARRWFAAAQEHAIRGEYLQAVGAYQVARSLAMNASQRHGPTSDEMEQLYRDATVGTEQPLRRLCAGLPEEC